MARVGNEVKLILSLARERMAGLRDSRVQTPSRDYQAGYNRAHSDWQEILDAVVADLEQR